MAEQDTPNGIPCPRCGLGGLTGKTWSVVRTEIESGAVVRERKCLNCKYRIQTKERLHSIIKRQKSKSTIHVSASDTDIQNALKNAEEKANRHSDRDGTPR